MRDSGIFQAGAFSNEVGSGSRKENASKKSQSLRSDSIGTEKAVDLHENPNPLTQLRAPPASAQVAACVCFAFRYALQHKVKG
jgi:hypothetical protein